MSIKAQIQYLAELQVLEIDIKTVNRLLAEIPEELEGLARQRSEFNLTIERVENEVDTLQKQYRSWEDNSQSISDRIAKEEEKLRLVKNNKEYQALLAGIDHFKTDRSAIEDRMIESLEASDDAEARLAGEKEAFSRFEVQLARQKEVINRRADLKQRQLEELEGSKSRLVDDLEPEFLNRFQHVKALKGDGLAVVPVQNAVCKGCNINIPPQLYNELQRFERLLMCPNCQRIIYHDPPAESDD
ncbi:MAG: C4-type zinc ribbon domain-containing protein [Thermodesulfobacteriota bacterium]|nr:C4-type zinc ribbon domain-containing protein [Thermodesulfobacteriota bacterium]